MLLKLPNRRVKIIANKLFSQFNDNCHNSFFESCRNLHFSCENPFFPSLCVDGPLAGLACVWRQLKPMRATSRLLSYFTGSLIIQTAAFVPHKTNPECSTRAHSIWVRAWQNKLNAYATFHILWNDAPSRTNFGPASNFFQVHWLPCRARLTFLISKLFLIFVNHASFQYYMMSTALAHWVQFFKTAVKWAKISVCAETAHLRLFCAGCASKIRIFLVWPHECVENWIIKALPIGTITRAQ